MKKFFDLQMFSWATITSSSGGSTVAADSVNIIRGTNKSDTVKANPIDHAARVIYGNGGNDLVNISGNYGILWSESTISGGAGKDSIYISGDVDGIHPSNVDIDGGAGNDFVSIYGGYAGLHGGTIGLEDDEKTAVSVKLGNGDDSIFIAGGNRGIDISKVTISGGAGRDLISISGDEYGIGGWADYGKATVSVDGGIGADTISVNSIDESNANVTIVAGASDNISVGSGSAKYIFDSTKKISINGAIFTASSKNISANIKTGSDAITISGGWKGSVDFSDDTEIKTFDAAYLKKSVEITGNSLANQIKGGSGDDTIYGGAGEDNINGGSGNDKIYSNGANATLSGGNGKDTLELWGTQSVINGGAGNDTIFTHTKNATINSGTGNDYVENWDDNVGRSDDGDGNDKITTGKGNDTVKNFGSGATINTGKGNDVIQLLSHGRDGNVYTAERNVIQHASGDGKDTIEGFNSDDTLHITKGSYSVKISGNDVIVKVGKGSITLKNAAGESISIKDSSGKVTTKTYGSSALFAENNFATADNLSAIVENNLGAADYNLEMPNFENLSQENLIAYAK